MCYTFTEFVVVCLEEESQLTLETPTYIMLYKSILFYLAECTRTAFRTLFEGPTFPQKSKNKNNKKIVSKFGNHFKVYMRTQYYCIMILLLRFGQSHCREES